MSKNIKTEKETPETKILNKLGMLEYETDLLISGNGHYQVRFAYNSYRIFNVQGVKETLIYSGDKVTVAKEACVISKNWHLDLDKYFKRSTD